MISLDAFVPGPSVQELQLLDFLFVVLSTNSKYWRTLPSWYRSLLNKGGGKSPPHKGGSQTVLSVHYFSPTPPRRLQYRILSRKWWPSCVTFRMGKSKTNPQILKTATKLLAHMRKWVAKANQEQLCFEEKSSIKGKAGRKRTKPRPSMPQCQHGGQLTGT